MDRTVVADLQAPVATVTVDRPRARNALSSQVLTELLDTCTSLGGNPAVAGVVLTGAPGPAFVAGADIREMAALDPAQGAKFGALGQEVTRALEALPVPVIACVDGYALGGGCELALACDLVYATPKAVFGQPEVLLGLIPGFGGCVRLPRQVGPGRARELIFTGRHVDAAEAHRIGLVTELFDSREAMLAAARATITAVSRNSRDAVALAKKAVNASRGRTVDDGLELELSAFRSAFTSPDMREGTSAFLGKREPVFGSRTAR
ncbi:enoyl-CoA hydratase/isomerase family protein [Amycolatopsis sp.]|uniref:enoyl-CoA hydratase/isomerase family protein n=1 Tax=Amycolatopsis sp. TaxID=37632 RepID=UPI002D7F7302|nr:enoyl-CoA hydratase-related protein [Amycolatopsis sp.]HET6704980.1 enoyl-CoA hydratase-related protein [Amycolatopsis sp.]